MRKFFLCLPAILLLLRLTVLAASEGGAEVVYLDTSPLIIIGVLGIITLLRKGGKRR